KGLHLLRHTLAMRLTAKGTNLVVIQKILRHANLNTTTIYAKATNDTIKTALLNN
ncbi:integrase, partial [Campylobacter jejuni]|nr:integrase [Campylobacter jejuni]EGG0586253.1 tyrosine-type recombinase/integrase [Campylobacter jejuni]